MKAIPIGVAAIGGAALALCDVDGSPLGIMRLAVAGVALGGASATDLAEHRIPNRLVLPAAAACAVLTIGSGFSATTVVGLGVVTLLLGIALVEPGTLGMGDVKLMLVVVLGLRRSALLALFLALALAGLVAVASLISKGREARGKSLPLAPFLALGSLLALL